MIFNENLTIQEKLAILADGAKYDVACTSSGVERKGRKGEIGNTAASGICHSFAADGRCISLLKILFTNECIFNCRYCINRSSNDVPRATFTPEEVCTLTMEFYKRNYIEGLFLSSGIVDSPDHTMELICQTLRDLRTVHRFNGYIHCKAIPGAASALIEEAASADDNSEKRASALKRLESGDYKPFCIDGHTSHEFPENFLKANPKLYIDLSSLSDDLGEAVDMVYDGLVFSEVEDGEEIVSIDFHNKKFSSNAVYHLRPSDYLDDI